MKTYSRITKVCSTHRLFWPHGKAPQAKLRAASSSPTPKARKPVGGPPSAQHVSRGWRASGSIPVAAQGITLSGSEQSRSCTCGGEREEEKKQTKPVCRVWVLFTCPFSLIQRDRANVASVVLGSCQRKTPNPGRGAPFFPPRSSGAKGEAGLQSGDPRNLIGWPLWGELGGPGPSIWGEGHLYG